MANIGCTSGSCCAAAGSGSVVTALDVGVVVVLVSVVAVDADVTTGAALESLLVGAAGAGVFLTTRCCCA
jgi:hypothetical protein